VPARAPHGTRLAATWPEALTMVIRVERRREARERAYMLVNVSRVDREGAPTDQELGRTLDLSRGGARVEVAEPIGLGTKVQVDLALRNELLEAQAVVRHLEPGDDGLHRLGLEFIDLQEPFFGRVDTFLRARSDEALQRGY
jgi:hypothetical protein